MNYIFKGTNGSMGLVTGNKYEISLSDGFQDSVVAKIFLTIQPVLVGRQELAEGPNIPYMPFVLCPYDTPDLFKNNWRVADECRCTNPGQDDGSNTCWVHHNCMTGDCTHGE